MELVAKYWELGAYLITGTIGGVIWAQRIHNQGSANQTAIDLTNRRVDALESKVDNLDSEVMKELRRQGESLARIEGHLGVKAHAP